MDDRIEDHLEIKNKILCELPREELDRLLPHMERITLEAGTILHEVGDPAQPVYFIEDGIASELLSDKAGNSIELCVVGSEGIMGERAIFGRWGLNDFQCVLFSDSTAYKIPPKILNEEFKRGGRLQELVLGRIEARLIETSQTALCAQSHTVEQRMCLWLLTLAYRSHSNQFHVTQEHLSNMLGVRRSTITDIAGGFKEAGIVEYSRGCFTILDSEALQMSACECFEVIKKASHAPFDR